MKKIIALLLLVPALACAHQVSDWSGYTQHSGDYSSGAYYSGSGETYSTDTQRNGRDAYSQSTYTDPNGASVTQHCTSHVISGGLVTSCY